MHLLLSNLFAVAEARSLMAPRSPHDTGIFATSSATGTGGPALRSIKTPGKTSSARRHYTILSRLPAKFRPTGIPYPIQSQLATISRPCGRSSPVVQSRIVKKNAKSKGKLAKATKDAAKPIMAGTATALGQPPVQSTAPPALNLKSAMKSSSGKPRTVARVVFEESVKVASINNDAAWSRPESPTPLKKEGPAKKRVVVATPSRIPRLARPKLVNAAFNLDLTKYLDT
ncbi:MAG: hypothetical protein Q9185_003297 [Variospora sp. 1 TL-2023]